MPVRYCARHLVVLGVILVFLIIPAAASGCRLASPPEQEVSTGPEPPVVGEEEEHDPLPPEPADVLHVALRAEQVALDPEEIGGGDLVSSVIARQIFRGLASVNSEGKAEKDLASDWWYEKQGRVWHVKITEGVELHDGTEVTAGLLMSLWEESLDGPQDSPRGLALSNVEAVEALDRHHLRFRLTRKDRDFPTSALTAPSLLVGVFAEDTPVGCGPYRFHTSTSEGAVVLRAAEDSEPRFTSLVFHLLDPEVQFSAPETWDERTAEVIDRARLIMFVRPCEASGAKPALQMRLLSRPGFNVRGLVLNDRRSPLDSQLVRQAVFAAIGDGDSILKRLAEERPQEGIAYLASVSTWLPASHPAQQLVDFELSSAHDPNRAEQLMEAADLTRSAGRQWKYRIGEASVPFTCAVLVPEDGYAAAGGAAEVIADRLRDIGVQVQIEQVGWRQFLSRYFSRQYDLAFVGWSSWSGSIENFLFPWVHSEGVNTINQLDRLQADRPMTQPEDGEIFGWLGQESLLLPLYTTEVIFAACPGLELPPDFLPVFRFSRLR